MNINSLRVFNSLYNLGIAEQEFKDIEDEQTHTERTGLYIACVTKARIVAVSHDQKHSIIIKKIKGTIKPIPKSRVLFKTLVTLKDLPKNIFILHSIAQYHN